MEPLVFGTLSSPKCLNLNVPELLSRIIFQYGYKPEEEDLSETRPLGPGYNAGATNELIKELKKRGYGELAYAIIRSTSSNKEFPDYPQVWSDRVSRPVDPLDHQGRSGYRPPHVRGRSERAPHR